MLATIIGLAVAVYAFTYGPFRTTYQSERQVKRIEVPKAPVVQGPVVKGPAVRELPLPEK